MSATSVELFDSLTDAQILERLRDIEAARRELEQRECAIIAQVSTRSLAFVHGCKSTVDFARALLTIGAVDAARRLKLADAVTPRRSPTGELLPAEHEDVAAAFAAGAISGAAAVTIAQTVKLSRQLWEDYPALEAQLESRLLRGLRRVEEAQLLLGTGAGGQMLGLMTAATSQGLTVPLSGQALLDGIQAAAAALTAAGPGYVATGVVLNPSDWIAAQRSQPSLAMASSGLWGLQAAASIAMPVGNFLVGAFDVGCQLYDREDAHVEIADENMDDFVKDLLTARAEERLALAIYTPAAFRKAA